MKRMEQTLTELLSQFKHRSVRDLAWVIASPPLVSGNIDDVLWWSHADCLLEFDDCLTELAKLDLDPTPLNNHLSNLKNKKLGATFEGLISFWLSISPNYQEKQHNIQIIEDKHTHGEIDFIIEELATGQYIHLEVAVKFYLGSTPYTDAYRWFGTTTADQLGKKINHLKYHQTQLSKKYPKQLKKHFSHRIDQRHCLVKGRLFYPENSDISPQNMELTENHLRGRWCYVNDRDTSNRVIKINKSNWLAELNTEDINNMNMASTESIEAINRAECYVEVEKEDNALFEKERSFYLPTDFSFPEAEHVKNEE